MYFKKALSECENEWDAQNKAIIATKGVKKLASKIPRHMPYFSVDFGIGGGFAHVIEDERKFPKVPAPPAPPAPACRHRARGDTAPSGTAHGVFAFERERATFERERATFKRPRRRRRAPPPPPQRPSSPGRSPPARRRRPSGATSSPGS